MEGGVVGFSYLVDLGEMGNELSILVWSLIGRVLGLVIEMEKGGEDIWEGEGIFLLVMLD